MDIINNMNFEDFDKMIRNRDLPYIPKKKRIDNKPLFIRTVTGGFHTSEQIIFYLYNNRQLFKYYSLDEIIEKTTVKYPK